MEQRIKGTTGLLALIGSPVGHSGSPDMYNFCFRYHNLDYCYMAFDIKEDQVPAALDAMRLFNMRGCNVTMPCKTAAAQNMDELSPAARIIGAVNTIVNEKRQTGWSYDRRYRICIQPERPWRRCKRKENGSFRCRWSSNSDPGTVCTGRRSIHFHLQSE